MEHPRHTGRSVAGRVQVAGPALGCGLGLGDTENQRQGAWPQEAHRL